MSMEAELWYVILLFNTSGAFNNTGDRELRSMMVYACLNTATYRYDYSTAFVSSHVVTYRLRTKKPPYELSGLINRQSLLDSTYSFFV